jgi:hypothetical protein
MNKFSSLFLGVFFINFLIPKAGIKIGDFPITLGYISLFLLSIPFAFNKSISLFSIPKPFPQAFLAWIPFQILASLHFIYHPPLEQGFFISFCLHFLVFPPLFYLYYSNPVFTFSEAFFLKGLKFCFFIVSAFGIIQFFYKQIAGSFIELPGITVNLSDAGTLEESKFIDRGGVYKLISTYGNGNLFGISLLFFYPLILEFENSHFRKWITRIAFILTLSRTVWIGFLLVEFLTILKRKPFIHFIKFALLVFAIYSLDQFLIALQDQNSFLMDNQLGGREEQLQAISKMSIFGHGGFDGIYEMIYMGLIKHFGIVGTGAFLLGYLYPLYEYLQSNNRSIFSRRLFEGLCLYLLVAIADGAILLIPVLFLYFFMATLLLQKLQTTPISAS